MAHPGRTIRGGAAALVMLGVAACGDGPTPPDLPVATVEVSPDTATRAGAPGTAMITASSEGQDGTAAVTVWRPEVLVGAGDIAECGSIGAPATALLLDTIPGTVFTAADNVYPSGSDDDFANCYDPTWGRHKARTRPATGNHAYPTPDAAG